MIAALATTAIMSIYYSCAPGTVGESSVIERTMVEIIPPTANYPSWRPVYFPTYPMPGDGWASMIPDPSGAIPPQAYLWCVRCRIPETSHVSDCVALP